MTGSHTWIEHTGELELALEADSRDGLFAEALAALGVLLAEREGEDVSSDRGTVGVEVAVSAPDPATLLAEWLSELAFRAESDRLIPEGVDVLDVSDVGLEATVAARRGDPPHLVKAVTYHRLGVWKEEGTWRARVVLDV